MPEQLTKHPEVTLQVLRSSGAKCAQGEAQDILAQCPAERFCKLPGGEICVFGLSDASRMTQITATEWSALVPAAPPAAPRSEDAFSGEALLSGGIGLLAGAAIGFALARLRHRPH
jgi:hypothetical protein